MEVRACLRYSPMSAQKARLVVDQIRGLSAEKAVTLLEFSPKKAAHSVKKALDSAIANAEHNHAADIDDLKVTRVFVDEGPTLKRFRARARGRGDQILKRSCHITVMVGDGRGEEE